MPKLINTLPDDHYITEYIRHFQPMSGGFTEFKHACAVNLLGISTERRAFMRLSFADIYPCIWSLILGQAGNSGKSTSIDQMRSILRPAGIGAALPNRYSREALYEALSEHPQAYMTDAECGALLSGMHRAGSYLNGLADDLCEIYDAPDYLQKRNSRKGGNQKNLFEIHDLFVNLLYATTPSTFEENTIPQDLESGLLSRFLIYHPSGKPEYVPVSISTTEASAEGKHLSERLQEINNAVTQFRQLSLIPSEKSLKKYNEWQAEVWQTISQNTNEATISARMRIYCFKLAMLYYCGAPQFITDAHRIYQNAVGGNLSFIGITDKPEALYGELVIPDQYFDAAYDHVVSYFYPAATTALHEAIDFGEKTSLNQIEKVLKKAPNMQLSRSDLLRKVKCSARELNELLFILADDGKITEGKDTSTDERNRPKNTQYIMYIGNGGSI